MDAVYDLRIFHKKKNAEGWDYLGCERVNVIKMRERQRTL